MEIRWHVSGELIAALDFAAFQGNSICMLKKFLAPVVGASRFRQKMFSDTLQEMWDHEIIGPAAPNIRLLVLDFTDSNAEQIREMVMLAGASRIVDLEHRLQDRWNPNVINFDGFTPLQKAVRNDDLQTVKLLFEANADVNQKTNEVRVPLHIAARRGNIQIVRFLIENGSNKDHTVNGETPLWLAASECHEDVNC